ncbi:SIR2 family protein [Rhizobium sp. WSM4643]|uniref:SIR2 family protein n=1 Tax=Rhizobium sp. WSM4643 TaxID=3138253 RepID=UPI0021A7103A|nr:SIR2 family protein [Rhizobium leguminosarum]UWM76961.1 SIR2 family protein [Rhizobium leguminosarum bv. viciae]
MFNTKTVFIVGAGASVDVGLPTGAQLKTKIREYLGTSNYNFNNYNIRDGLVSHLQRNRERIETGPYIEAAEYIANAMPVSHSIDHFLFTHAKKPQVVTMGKLAIAATLLDAEYTSDLRLENNRIDLIKTENYWLNSFCRFLTEEVQDGDFEDIFDNVAIITFNYDRCIEHYLAHHLATYYVKPIEEAYELARRLTVVHLYGQLGHLPWRATGQQQVPFGQLTSGESVATAMSTLHTFTEQATEKAILHRVRRLVAEAERLVFMGFAFQDLNMQLLLPEDNTVYKEIFGTVSGISKANAEKISSYLTREFTTLDNQKPKLYLDHVHCNQLLLDYWRIIFDPDPPEYVN